MILYLVRHGRTLDAEGLCVGHCDLAMDPAAADGLRTLSASFEARPTRLVSSDLSRARTTLDVLAERWDAPRSEDARLREMDFGAWDGRRWDALQAEDGGRLSAWMAAWVATPAPDGESFEQVATRTAEWLAELRESDAESVLAVAHAGSIRALLCTALDWPLERAFRLQVDHGRASALYFGRETRLLFLNADRLPR